jgi:PAS domain S-box-containing protein
MMAEPVVGKTLAPAPARRPAALRFGVAPPAVTLAAVLQFVLIGDRAPFILILPTIMAVAWYGGRGPGLLATGIGALQSAYLFFDPPFSIRVDDPKKLFVLAVFGLMGTAISLLIERLQKTEHARRQAEGRLLWKTQHSLRNREERLQAILDSTIDSIITIDHQGIIQSVNPGAEQMFGYAASEMVGQSVTMLMPSPYREEHDAYIARYLETGEKHIIGISREIDARRKDGSIIPTELAVSEITQEKIFVGIHRDLTARKRLEREVVESAVFEQRRIGQDLHDSVAQELTALNLLAKDLSETIRIDPENASKLVGRIQQGLQQSQRELRDVLLGLLPVSVEGEGLMAALSDLVYRAQQEGKANCTFECPKPVLLADNTTATQFYLIAQEAFHNALKHGRPRNVRISLLSNHALTLRVECDGIGMPGGPSPPEGLGLRIMRNRAAIIGADLTIEPAKLSGTVVTCSLSRKNNVRS